MLCGGGYYYHFSDSDPRRWNRCRIEAIKQMVAKGWKTYANKFDRVMNKLAFKLWKDRSFK